MMKQLDLVTMSRALFAIEDDEDFEEFARDFDDQMYHLAILYWDLMYLFGGYAQVEKDPRREAIYRYLAGKMGDLKEIALRTQIMPQD